MTESLDLLERAQALLSRVARVDRSMLSDDELVAFLKADEAVGRFVDAARVLDAGEVGSVPGTNSVPRVCRCGWGSVSPSTSSSR